MQIIIISITLLLINNYSHCYYKFWQYYAKYAYHAEKLSHSHSCFLERELPLMQIAGWLRPHPPSLPPSQPCFSTQNWSSGNVKILLNTSCSIQGVPFFGPRYDSRSTIHRIHKWRTSKKKLVPSHESEASEDKQKLPMKTFSELVECLARIPPKISLYRLLFRYNYVGCLLLLMFSVDLLFAIRRDVYIFKETG